VKDSIFYKQAELVLRILPDILVEEIFALKGGTAINFFFKDLPRLSVDIDLTYLPLTDRGKALQDIHDALQRISDRLKRKTPGAKITPRISRETSLLIGLIVTRDDATVKIEPNAIMRGTVYPVQVRPLTKRSQELFEFHIEARTLSLADLYGGKICAALDRQHPRDLYDIHLLFRTEGITDEIRKAFIVYLICQPRPILEILNPSIVDIRGTFEKEFHGMVLEPVTCELLEEERKRLFEEIKTGLTDEEKFFIVSVKEGKPRWELIRLAGIELLPALRWKLINIEKMTPKKHSQSLHMLKEFLGL
jgi:predicted nucleotidyltransferase component of viral defense system